MRPLKRIMIVDDHDLVRRGLCSVIELRAHFQVVAECSTGEEALQAARETEIDIAIVDYMLPDIMGLDLTRSLRSQFPLIEVLMYTAHNHDDVVTNVMCMGARGFLLKTDPPDDLLDALDALSLRRPYFSRFVSPALVNKILDPKRNSSFLTTREHQILGLIAQGYKNKEAAKMLGISIKTMETHRASVMCKTKCNTTADLVRYAIRNAIISL